MSNVTKLPAPEAGAMTTGGAVSAIIPHTVDEIWRVSKMVVESGIAPDSLVKVKGQPKEANAACSAVAICIMAGAELGLPPMVSLRAFTVINGKPALYGDGLINVVRRSGRAAFIRVGFDKEAGTGWCEAKRADTGEESRVEFTLDEARRAGLLIEAPKITKYGKNGSYQADNDSPWYRYPQRMAPWRAAGYCLRDLFADVLGGMPTADELTEIERFDNARDITPAGPPPAPPPPVQEAAAPKPESLTPAYDGPPPAPVDHAPEPEPEDAGELIGKAIDWFANASTPDALEQAFDAFRTLHEGDLGEDDMALVKNAYDERLEELEPNNLAAG